MLICFIVFRMEDHGRSPLLLFKAADTLPEKCASVSVLI
jgi:hypothetical protein